MTTPQTETEVLPFTPDREEDLMIQVLTHHLRQQALLQRTPLPRWAIW